MSSGYEKEYIDNIKLSNKMLRRRIIYLEAKNKMLEDRLYKKTRTRFCYRNLVIKTHDKKKGTNR
jgi:hypothetical protein